jgi:hypothetical protein
LRQRGWGVVWKLLGKAERRVGDPSFMTCGQRTVSVEDGTLSHNLPQQVGA